MSAATIRVGDLVHVQGQERAVRDMKALPGRRKLLIFDGGATYLLSPASCLPAYRSQPCP
ncbi:hypothetical protein [Streptomyces sp. Ru87]|uniref:hypothetical protein n=1 Tax=Streptomyces sp. Ru87 TaxID=2044307 RepID=UPI00117D619C|nr:hypothetical protein [Streptomyces sp. Ru87]